MRQTAVCLKWEQTGPRARDLVIRKQGIPIFVDARVYVNLADYELDLEGRNGSRQFVLRHKRVTGSDDQGEK